MSWFESESDRKQREHDEGEKEGAKADLVGGALYDILFSHIDPTHSDEWKAGWENGRNNRSKD